MFTRWNEFDRTFALMDELRRRFEHGETDFDTPRGFALEDTFARGTFPQASLVDTGSSLVLKADLPGMLDKDVKLSVYQDVLSIQGERRSDAPEGYTVHRQERPAARFARSFTLPCKVDSEKTAASLKDGILTVTLPKAPEAQPRQIAIRGA